MAQSKSRSIWEAILNVLIGSGVALAAQLVLFPVYDIHVNLSTDLALTFWFTVVSLIRSYLIRRYMNRKDHICK